jgi:uncharacterized membrane protein YqiK
MDLLTLAITAFCIVGIWMLLFSVMITRAYVKVPANRAFVRTGGFFRRPDTRPQVVMNGGGWVFKAIHEITWVDLSTLSIEIERVGQEALLTQDLQPVDVRVVFHVKVNPTLEGVLDAARALGGKAVDAPSVGALLKAKVSGALRDVIASLPFMSLHQEPEKLVQEIQKRLKGDLEENGLVLESVSIVALKPT